MLLFMGQSYTSICQTWFTNCIRNYEQTKYDTQFENIEWIIDDLIQYAPYTCKTTFNVIHVHHYKLSRIFNDWMLHLRCGIENGKFSVYLCEK